MRYSCFGRGNTLNEVVKEVIDLQKQLAKQNIIFYGVLCIFILEQYARYNDKSFLSYLGIIFLIMIIDVLCYKFNYFNHVNAIRYLRIFQISIVCYCLLNTNYPYSFGMSLIVLLCLAWEFILSFDVLDPYYKVLSIFFIGIPMVFNLIIRITFLNNTESEVFLNIFFIFVLLYVITITVRQYSQILKKYDDRSFDQIRLINNVNAINHEIKTNQEKLKKANELLGIQKIQLESAYQRINTANTETTIQYDILKHISSALEIDKLMNRITDAILNEIGVDICAIMLKPGAVGNKQNEYEAKTRLAQIDGAGIRQILASGALDKYMNRSVNFIDNQVEIEKYSFLHYLNQGSIMFIPLIHQEEQIGSLFVGDRRSNFFHENILFFESIMSQFLIALTNANLYLSMENMAIRDGLTGIYNRRHFTKLLEECIKEAIQYTTPLTVALFDIDFFKRINDTYGHLYGDQIIKTLAQLSNQCAGEYKAFVARFGGEEFVMVFPNKNIEDTFTIISELHTTIRTYGFYYQTERVSIDVSFGLASYPETCLNPNLLVQKADEAMYISKQQGRGRITIDGAFL